MKNSNNKMLTINLFISKYLLFALPIVIGTVVWAMVSLGDGSDVDGKFQSILWDIFGWHFLIWFVALLYFLFVLVISTSFREVVLSKITRSEERDERESYISGRASKATFLLTLAVMIVLLFMSGLQLNIYNPTKEARLEGHKGHISVNYSLEFLDMPKEEGEESKGMLLDFKGIPLSKEAIMLFLILIHVGGYHMFTRKKLRE